jgi:glycosyltransferase involved in cell wall biosynthesis
MKIAWFTPFCNKSAIGKVSKIICEELIKTEHVDIWTASKEDIIETVVKVEFFSKSTEAEVLRHYDFIIYNIGNYAEYHKDIYEMSQKKPGVIIVHDQTLYSFWAEYFLMPQFGMDYNQGFLAYKNMFLQYYGKAAEELAVEAIQSGHVPIYEYKTMSVYKLIEPIVKTAVGVFTHAGFFVERIKEFYNGPVGYSYLPCEAEPMIDNNSIVVNEIIQKARAEHKLVMLSNGMVQPLKRIDKVTNVLLNNKKLSNQICYIVIGSYNGAYGERLKQLSKKELKDCLYMLGYQDSNEMNYALQNVDLCINLRYPNSEVCSLSLFEQMAYGKPTIVINSGVYGEMNDNCVIKVTIENEEKELEEELLRILYNKELYDEYGNNAKTFIQKYCNTVTYCERLLEFLQQLMLNSHMAALQNRFIYDIGYKLNGIGVSFDTVPSTMRNVINHIDDLFWDKKTSTSSNKVIGVWAGYQMPITNIKSEILLRNIAYMIDVLMQNYPISIEIWCYSLNKDEIIDGFSSLAENINYDNRISFITEENWVQTFQPNPENSLYEQEINEQRDNLCDLARDYSKADCFILLDEYLDNAIGTDKPIFVPIHDTNRSYTYYDFVKDDSYNKSRYLDYIARIKNLARSGANFIIINRIEPQSIFPELVKDLSEDKLTVIKIPVSIQEGTEDNTADRRDSSNNIKVSDNVYYDEAKEYFKLFFHNGDYVEATKNEI